MYSFSFLTSIWATCTFNRSHAGISSVQRRN
nr:MAG TPA: hypothetical protein [Caudoviricetes sp.]